MTSMGFTRLLTRVVRRARINTRSISTLNHESQRQSDLFYKEKKRQLEAIGRIEKIEVRYNGALENGTFIMNKGISTPNDVAKHIGEKCVEKSAVALINKETLWHMHKPLKGECDIEFLDYKMAPQPSFVNKAFWRTCSFLLGAVIQHSFKEDVRVLLHSFPSPNVRSGSFVYDVELKSLDDWKPTENELRVLSIDFIKFCQQNHDLEYLEVSQDVALEMFRNNEHKTKQIPFIAQQNDEEKVTLFKAGYHIDISRGPLIANTRQLGRITVSNVHKLDVNGEEKMNLYRFQGVALPSYLVINHFAYGLLEERARKLNPARIPGSDGRIISEDNTFVSSIAV